MLRLYLKKVRGGIIFFVFTCAVAAGIFSLYHLPVAAVAYTAAVCGFFGILKVAADYRKFVLRHKNLERLILRLDGVKADEAKELVADQLPRPGDLLEEDYQKLLNLLAEDCQELAEETARRYEELVDYYTIWVHQIKTPIAAMGLILQSGGEGSQMELQEELRRIEQYVEMVLCYLRLDAGSTDYVIKEYDLDSIVKQAVRKNASMFIRKKIRLVYEPTGARVVTDEKWLLFVIEQILSNALKYTSEQGTIWITLEEPKTLCIRDNGIGIAPGDLPRIFDKGYTGSNGRTDKKASGIGMYLSRRICGNLGHQIAVTSTLGEGTKVCLDLKNAELEIE